MKKLKIFVIFILGILSGALIFQINQQWQSFNDPTVEQNSFNISALINSIAEQIHAQDLNIIDEKYDRFESVYQLLEENYYDEENLDQEKMLEEAVKSYVDAIDDPYTVYLNAQQNSGFQENLKGQQDFEGIGAVVTKKDYYVLIEEVLKESPAYNAGLMPLDRIIAVDEKTTKDEDLQEAVNRIKGPQGTDVLLTIERHDDDEVEIFDVTVTRDELIIPSVTSKIVSGAQDTTIGYINIAMIGEETERLLRKEIIDMENYNIEGIIIDLRGNGGGFLPVAVEVASHFVPKGELVVTAKYKTFTDEEYFSKGYNDFPQIPIVVMINQMTASAGEIITLALQEQIGATVVGEQSFGKGSIQTLQEFPDNDSLKYTIGKRYAPSGKNIDQEGITPDVMIEFDADAYQDSRTDNQLEEAKNIIVNQLNQ